MIKRGCIEVICGPMFAGKTEELIRRLRRAKIARQRVQAFKASIDRRYDPASIVSHDAATFDSLPVGSSEELVAAVEANAQVVGIDEVQFFDAGIVRVAQGLANRGVRVVVAGLDADFRAEAFESMAGLLAVAESVSKLHAVCSWCGGEASRSRRIDGSEARVEVGGVGRYEAVCRACFVAGR
jgi:thymidine kinase